MCYTWHFISFWSINQWDNTKIDCKTAKIDLITEKCDSNCQFLCYTWHFISFWSINQWHSTRIDCKTAQIDLITVKFNSYCQLLCFTWYFISFWSINQWDNTKIDCKTAKIDQLTVKFNSYCQLLCFTWHNINFWSINEWHNTKIDLITEKCNTSNDYNWWTHFFCHFSIDQECFSALLELAKWAWAALKVVIESSRRNEEAQEADSLSTSDRKEDLSHIIFVCRVSMRLLRFYILELYPSKSTSP